MQIIATKSIHIIIQELLHGNTFSPWEGFSLTLSVLMTSVLNNYVSVHVYNIMYIGTGAGRNICSGTMNRFCSREVYKIVSLTQCLLVPIVVF